MSVVSGRVTFGSSGNIMVYVGINVNDLDFYAGARDATIETVGLLSVGHADAGKQFTHAHKDDKSETVQGKAMRAYDGAGNIVLEFTVASGWGTPVITFNVTAYNPNYPFELVART